MNKQFGMNRQRHIPLRMRWCITGMLAAFMLATSAQAQLRLPALPVPATPNVQLPQVPANTNDVTSRLDSIVVDAASELDSRSERLLRAARVRALLRANASTLETDTNGAPVLRGQVVSLSPTS